MKRAIKKRGVVESVKEVAKDVAAGFGELKRQSGSAVANVKAGVEKIKRAVKK